MLLPCSETGDALTDWLNEPANDKTDVQNLLCNVTLTSAQLLAIVQGMTQQEKDDLCAILDCQ